MVDDDENFEETKAEIDFTWYANDFRDKLVRRSCSVTRTGTIVRLLGDFVIQIVRWTEATVENRF